MAVADNIAASELNCQAGFSVLVFQPDIVQNRALAFRREFFVSNPSMQIANLTYAESDRLLQGLSLIRLCLYSVWPHTQRVPYCDRALWLSR